jgi:hypothetical protein
MGTTTPQGTWDPFSVSRCRFPDAGFPMPARSITPFPVSGFRVRFFFLSFFLRGAEDILQHCPGGAYLVKGANADVAIVRHHSFPRGHRL